MTSSAIDVPTLRPLHWGQFGAAIDTLEQAMEACPEGVWGERLEWGEFWYLTFHTLFYLDLYLSDTLDAFAPPPPFGLEELDPNGVLPPRVYSKGELATYLAHRRREAEATIGGLDVERATGPSKIGWFDFTFMELLLDNMRHVQHHAAQLNLLLRQRADRGSRWLSRAAVRT